MTDGRSEGEPSALLERRPGAWVHLACRRWEACFPSLDWEQRPRSGEKHRDTADFSVHVGAIYRQRGLQPWLYSHQTHRQMK